MPLNLKTAELAQQTTPIGPGSMPFAKKDTSTTRLSPVTLQLEFEKYFQNKVIIGRHRRLRYDLERVRQSQLTTEIPKTLILGDSIPEGTGATTASAKLHYRLGVYMQQWTGVGTNNDWTPTNYAVGGGDLSIVAPYLADDGDLGATLASNPRRTHRRGWFDLQGFSAVYFCAFRNAYGTMTQDQFREMFLMLCATCKRKNIDLFVVTPPPVVDATGAPAEGANYKPYTDIARVIAASEGATWVDMNLYLSREYERGNGSTDVNDLNAYMYTGDASPRVHLNDTGHDLMAQLMFNAITGEAADEGVSFGHREPLRTGRLVGKYVASVSPAAATAITGFAGASTARAQMRGEGATPLSFKLTAGQTISFQGTGPVRGVMISFIGGAANTGSFSATYSAVNILTSGTIYGQGGGSYARENSFYVPISRLNAVFGTVGSLVITANGGPLEILGVTFVQDDLIADTRYMMDRVDTGTWTNVTPTVGGVVTACRESTTIGDTVTVNFWGNGYIWQAISGVGRGKYTWQLDALTVQTDDLYAASADAIQYKNTQVYFPAVATGWHTLVFTLITKNAASSAQNTNFMSGRSFSRENDPICMLVPCESGQPTFINDFWGSAEVDRVLSGAPVLRFAPGATSITLTGGDAMVRLTR